MLHYSCCLLTRSWSISLVCPEMGLSNITQQVPIPEAISAYFRFPSLHIPGLNDIFTAKTIIFGPPVPLTPHLPLNTDIFMDVCPVFFAPTVRAKGISYTFYNQLQKVWIFSGQILGCNKKLKAAMQL